MAEEMIERVARALAKMHSHQNDYNYYLDDAKAAIAAMREPTEAMLDAGDNACDEGVGAKQAWPAMIDAALKE